MKYTSQGFRSVEACSISAAAVIFAERAARKQYGKSGYCRTCTQVACSRDGTFAEYTAVIEYIPRGQLNEKAGHNQSFVVHAASKRIKKAIKPRFRTIRAQKKPIRHYALLEGAFSTYAKLDQGVL
jgi:hypothetical protein